MNNTNESLDLDLTAAAGRGDFSAQRELVDRLLDPVRRAVTYISGGDQDAEDLVQSALADILVKVGTFRGEASLEYWANLVAVRSAIKTLKKTAAYRSFTFQIRYSAEQPRLRSWRSNGSRSSARSDRADVGKTLS